MLHLFAVIFIGVDSFSIILLRACAFSIRWPTTVIKYCLSFSLVSHSGVLYKKIYLTFSFHPPFSLPSDSYFSLILFLRTPFFILEVPYGHYLNLPLSPYCHVFALWFLWLLLALNSFKAYLFYNLFHSVLLIHVLEMPIYLSLGSAYTFFFLMWVHL